MVTGLVGIGRAVVVFLGVFFWTLVARWQD